MSRFFLLLLVLATVPLVTIGCGGAADGNQADNGAGSGDATDSGTDDPTAQLLGEWESAPDHITLTLEAGGAFRFSERSNDLTGSWEATADSDPLAGTLTFEGGDGEMPPPTPFTLTDDNTLTLTIGGEHELPLTRK